MTAELSNLKEIGRYLNVSAERARQVAADDPTFPAPASAKPRRWSRAKVERWAERHWWDTWPWRKRPAKDGAIVRWKDVPGHVCTMSRDITLVPPAGIEPATHGLGNRCSLH